MLELVEMYARFRSAGGSEHGRRQVVGFDSAVFLEFADKCKIECSGDSRTNAFGGSIGGAITQEKAGAKDVYGLKGQGLYGVFKFALNLQVEGGRVRIGTYGGNQQKLGGATSGGGGRVGQLCIEVDFTEGFARTRLAHGGTECAEGVSSGKVGKLREIFEVCLNLLQFGMVPVDGTPNECKDAMVIRGFEQKRQAMAADETGSACKNSDAGQSPSGSHQVSPDLADKLRANIH